MKHCAKTIIFLIPIFFSSQIFSIDPPLTPKEVAKKASQVFYPQSSYESVSSEYPMHLIEGLDDADFPVKYRQEILKHIHARIDRPTREKFFTQVVKELFPKSDEKEMIRKIRSWDVAALNKANPAWRKRVLKKIFTPEDLAILKEFFVGWQSQVLHEYFFGETPGQLSQETYHEFSSALHFYEGARNKGRFRSRPSQTGHPRPPLTEVLSFISNELD